MTAEEVVASMKADLLRSIIPPNTPIPTPPFRMPCGCVCAGVARGSMLMLNMPLCEDHADALSLLQQRPWLRRQAPPHNGA